MLLESMNQHHNDIFHDRRFVFVLMMELFEVDEMINGTMNSEKQDLLKGEASIITHNTPTYVRFIFYTHLFQL